MAEDVIIQGFGDDRNFPDFATEATQKQLLATFKAMGLKGLKSEDLNKLIAAISSGDKNVADILKSIQVTGEDNDKKLIDRISDTNKKIENLRKQNRDGDKERDRDAEETKKILSEFSDVMSNIRDGLQTGELGVGDALGTLTGALGMIGGAAAGAATAFVGITAAVNGANQFMIGIGEDRFNLANEIRQSGLASSLSVAESGLVNFSEMVNRSSFSLGQAAEFANKFSAAVGGAGIERSLQFVEDMAYGGAEGADMMRRFGLEFGGVANVAGQYLESVRNLGMLDRMNNQQLRSGMEDFMETVTVTSNIMKINIQDAAEMIANTLNQRDDLTVMLAGLPEELRQRVTGIVSAMGAQGTQFGESISMALASTSFDEFLTTEQGQSLAGSNLGQEFIPLLRSVTDQIRMGADQGDVLASMEGPLRAIVSQFGDDGFRTLIAQNQDPLIRALGADFVRILDNIGDADAGNRADTTLQGLEDDQAFVERGVVQQEFVLAQENVMNALARTVDYAENLTARNQANMALIDSVEQNLVGIVDELGGEVAGLTFGADEAFRGAITAVSDFAGAIGRFVSDDMATASLIVQEQNRRAMEMLGIDEETIRRLDAEEQASRTQEARQEHINRTVGESATERDFDENLLRAALNFGETVHEVENDAGQNELRVSTGFMDPYGMSTEYMVVDPAALQRVIAEQDVQSNMLGRTEEFDVSDRFASRVLTALSQENGEQLAELLGANSTSSTFDMATSSTQAELAFVNEALTQLTSANALTEETVQRMITAIESIDTTGFWRGASTERAEAGERDALVAELRRLVNSLNGN